MSDWFHSWQGILGLFLESPCPLCQRSTSQEICVACQRRITDSQIAHPAETWQAETPVFAWSFYTGTVKRALTVLKYDNQPQLARFLGQALAQAWLKSEIPASITQRIIVVPIPLHAAKLKQRGFNQAELLAESFCDRTGLSLQRQGLERVRATAAQFELSATQRESNLINAFQIGKGLNHSAQKTVDRKTVDRKTVDRKTVDRKTVGQTVLLVDDIYTTGATARSAIQTLRQHHIMTLGLVTVARTPSL